MTATITYKDAPTKPVDIGGTRFAYRELGPATGTPMIFLNHLAAVLDNWDPRVVDGIAATHRVITFDNRGVGASKGRTPHTVAEMAKDAVAFIRALGFDPRPPPCKRKTWFPAGITQLCFRRSERAHASGWCPPVRPVAGISLPNPLPGP